MIKQGKINRTNNSFILIGVDGHSNSENFIKSMRQKKIEILIPFYQFSVLLIKYLGKMKINQHIYILFYLLKLNLITFVNINFKNKL